VSQQFLAAIVFVGVYLLIVSDRVHRTVAALVGAVAVIALGLLSQQEAFSDTYVDWNVIFLLVGMMAIANILAKTGLFEWLAAEAVLRTRGDAYRLLVLISLITAVVSAFIDNVTTVVLITPIIFVVAERLRVSPMPLLISEILASNIGGTATLIGDPPNIIIGSRLGKDFGDFIVNATPAIVVALVAYLIFARWLFRRELAASAGGLTKQEVEALATEERRIADVPLRDVATGEELPDVPDAKPYHSLKVILFQPCLGPVGFRPRHAYKAHFHELGLSAARNRSTCSRTSAPEPKLCR